MNQEAVVLAADVSEARASPSPQEDAQRLFLISKAPPIGVMVHNVAAFNGVKWPIVFEYFRNQTARLQMKVDDAYVRLVEFLQKAQYVSDFGMDRSVEVENFRQYVLGFTEGLFSVLDAVGWDTTFALTDRTLNLALADYEHDIRTEYVYDSLEAETRPRNHTEPTDGLIALFRDQFPQNFAEAVCYMCEARGVDPALALFSPEAAARIQDLALASCLVEWVPPALEGAAAGVVVAGFDPGHPYPQAISFRLYPSFGGLLKITGRRRDRIDTNWRRSAAIRTYARSEVIDGLVYAIDPKAAAAVAHEIRYYTSELKANLYNLGLDLRPGDRARVEKLFNDHKAAAPDILIKAMQTLPAWSNFGRLYGQVRLAAPDAMTEIAAKMLGISRLGLDLTAQAPGDRPIQRLTLTRDGHAFSESF